MIVGKVQVKPAPQSVSTLQASCHLYVQVETFVVVHTGFMFGTRHSALGGQLAPPEHAMIESV